MKVELRTIRYIRWARELISKVEAAEGEKRKNLLKEADEALDIALQFAGGKEFASDSVKQAIQKERERIGELQEADKDG